MKKIVLVMLVMVSTIGFSQSKKETKLKQLVSEVKQSLNLDDKKTTLLYDAMKKRNIALTKIIKKAKEEGLDKATRKEKTKTLSKKFRATLAEILSEKDLKKYKDFFKERASKNKK